MKTRADRTNGSTARRLHPTAVEPLSALPGVPALPGHGESELERLDRLDRLTGQLYEATIQPDGWHWFLSSLAEAVASDALTLIAVSTHAGVLRETTFSLRTDPVAETRHREHFAARDPWDAARSVEPAAQTDGGPARIHFSSDAVLAGPLSAYYSPPGWQHGFAARVLEDDGGMVAAIAGHQRPRRGGFEPEALELVRRLIPHLRRALRARQRLAIATLERDAGAQLLDHIAIGVIVVDEQGQVVRTNAAGNAVLAARDGLSLGSSGLEAGSREDTRLLGRSIAAAVRGPRPAGGLASARLTIDRPSGARPYLVEVAPLDETASIWGSSRVLAAILVGDGERQPAPRPEPLQTFYGLTRSEADLAVRLAEGRSLREIGIERGVTSNTARSQLKRVFFKTGTHRQADLVRLVLQGQAGLPVR